VEKPLLCLQNFHLPLLLENEMERMEFEEGKNWFRERRNNPRPVGFHCINRHQKINSDNIVSYPLVRGRVLCRNAVI